ncbi:response regulator transcription factor [Cyanobacterium aponinum]|uniref:Two component transcriptional regulator, winged helix family n=1 Tax=Cyanobacterium aponinum (strain PCC 10605) TaxID=755178 RepID=K9Z8C3_CYAAP|nr:response regulator transcription factor [Cyanobacterium aponinum]AFZ54623.1 two component transcriptional regulator, winged helix family [Cyanobacterium aponinum PCC 10605]
MTNSILVVEDDQRLSQFIVTELKLEGYEVATADDGMEALEKVREFPPDLIILDWMLPRISGLDVCLRLRKTGIKIPIILLTARDEIPDRVLGLNSGADDYLTKPFSIEELLARINARLRSSQVNDTSEILQFADLKLNLLTREVFRSKDSIELTAKEFDLLEYLLRHPRQVLSRNQIIENVWDFDFMGESNIIEVYIRALRLKLEVNQSPRLIHTVRGVGYVLKDSPS